MSGFLERAYRKPNNPDSVLTDNAGVTESTKVRSNRKGWRVCLARAFWWRCAWMGALVDRGVVGATVKPRGHDAWGIRRARGAVYSSRCSRVALGTTRRSGVEYHTQEIWSVRWTFIFSYKGTRAEINTRTPPKKSTSYYYCCVDALFFQVGHPRSLGRQSCFLLC